MSEAVKEPVDSAKVKSVTQQQTDENTTTTKTTNENKAEIEKKEVKTPQVQNGQKNEEIVSFQNLHIKHFWPFFYQKDTKPVKPVEDNKDAQGKCFNMA